MAWVVWAAVVVAAAAYAYFAFKGAPEQENMKPEGLDSFRVTYNQEGMPIPLHWGLVRLPGNLLWYGNLVTEEIKEDVGGKGSGGGGSVTTGYKYYLDHWQAVCMGPAKVFTIYFDDKIWKDNISGDTGTYDWYSGWSGPIRTLTIYYNYISQQRAFSWSSGNITADNPILTDMENQIGEYVTRLQGVAWAWFDRFLAGENRTFLPTLHFVVERYMDVPFSNGNLPNGANPAAIIYEVLRRAGVGYEEIDLSSFGTAAAYWAGRGYGLNIVLTSQTTATEAISKVFNYVDGVLYLDEDDKFVLKAYTETDSSVATITTPEFKDFQFERPSWDDVYSDFRAEYIAADKDFSKRSLRVINSAVRSLTGYTRQMSVDLTGFRDKTAASKRLWEIARKQSYPASSVSFTVGLKYLRRNVGDVITITNSDYGISSAQFRIVNKDMSDIDSNDLKFTAVQFLEGLFLDSYVPAGDPLWVKPTTYAEPAKYTKFFELPYNPVTLGSLAWLVLAQRTNLENGFIVRYSTNNNDFYNADILTTWSTRYTLNGAYPNTTEEIDDDVGMILTPDYKEDPEYTNIDRSDLFQPVQLAIVGNEIMAFQTYQPYGTSQVKITGIVRGMWNTPIETHADNAKVWLTTIGDNIVTGLNADTAYMKVLPFFENDVVPDDEVSTTNISINYSGLRPWPVGNVRAVRSGTSITVTWFPSSQTEIGAGAVAADSQDDEDPMKYSGDFEITDTLAEADQFVDGTSRNWTQAALLQTTVTVKSRRNGYLSAGRTVVVPTTDGTYWG